MTDRETLAVLIEKLDDALGSGDWLHPGDYEGLRSRYNALAGAADDVVKVARRFLEESTAPLPQPGEPTMNLLSPEQRSFLDWWRNRA